MQCKDVPEEPVLRFLQKRLGRFNSWCNGSISDVALAMPDDTPPKVVLRKISGLMRRGLVDGCDCGCAGSFSITQKGQEYLLAKYGEGEWEETEAYRLRAAIEQCLKQDPKDAVAKLLELVAQEGL